MAAVYEKPSEALAELFDKVKESTSIPHWVEFELLINNKLKDVYKIVKLNDLIGALTEGMNFVVVVNEEIIEQLPVELQEILLVESLAGVFISESDAISLEKPNFSTFTGVLQKYGHDKIIMMKESVKSLYDAVKQKEDEEKAQKKAKRAERAAKKAAK